MLSIVIHIKAPQINARKALARLARIFPVGTIVEFHDTRWQRIDARTYNTRWGVPDDAQMSLLEIGGGVEQSEEE
jgi:hypothetical protein